MSTLKQIQDVIKEAGDTDKLVELNLSEIKIGKFTPQIKKAIEKCTNLEILILSGCDPESLDLMPDNDLTAIDLTANKLGDSELSKLTKYSNLGQLIFNQNNITKLQSIKALQKLENLQELDFTDNPVTGQENYRDFVFKNLSQLEILDRFDKEGNQQVQQDEFEDYDDDGSDEEGDDDQDDDEEEEYDDDEEEQSPPPKKKR